MSGTDFLYLCVVSWAGLLCLMAVVLPGRKRAPVAVAVSTAPHAAPVAEAAPVETEASHEDKETKHWCAQGLRKLGYSAAEAQRMADQVPAGYSLQQAIEFCLYKRGAKK